MPVSSGDLRPRASLSCFRICSCNCLGFEGGAARGFSRRGDTQRHTPRGRRLACTYTLHSTSRTCIVFVCCCRQVVHRPPSARGHVIELSASPGSPVRKLPACRQAIQDQTIPPQPRARRTGAEGRCAPVQGERLLALADPCWNDALHFHDRARWYVVCLFCISDTRPGDGNVVPPRRCSLTATSSRHVGASANLPEQHPLSRAGRPKCWGHAGPWLVV
jgi:hypothetical protein